MEHKRAGSSVCKKFDVILVDKLLALDSKLGNEICSKVLHLSPPSAVHVTTTGTTTTTAVLTGNTDQTVASGVSTIAIVVTTTQTDGQTVVSTITSSVTNTETDVVATQVVTSVYVAPTPPATATTTKTVETFIPVLKRRGGHNNLGDVYPNVPPALKSIALALASDAYSCYLGPQATPTVTATASQTVAVTLNSITTSTVITPATTTTSTSTETDLTTSITTTSDVIVAQVTQSSLATTLTTTATTTTPAAPLATVLVPKVHTFSLASGPKKTAPGCTYNSYVDLTFISNSPDPAGTYGYAVDQCEALCSKPLFDGSTCQFFLYNRFDPATARGADYGACILDSAPYDPGLLQCGYPVQYYVAYSKLT